MAEDQKLQTVNSNDRTTLGSGRSGPRTQQGSEIIFVGKNDRLETVNFKFIVNPANLSRSRKKLGQYVLTKFGYERQNWGNDLTSFEYAGATGVFRPNTWQNNGAPDFDIRQTPTWAAFREFEDFYEGTGNNQNLVRMQYWGYSGSFLGSIDDFKLTYDPMKEPWVIRYTFKFTGLPLAQPTIETNVIGATPSNPSTDNARIDDPAT